MLAYKTTPGSAIQAAPNRTASQIAEQVVGEVTWTTATEGYCNCPGRSRHTHSNGPRDCLVYLDGVPTVHCVHASCQGIVNQTNHALRAALLNGDASGSVKPRKPSPEEMQQAKERQRREQIRRCAANSRPKLLKEFAWPYADICASSPVPVTDQEPADHWRLLLERFQPGDVVWIGDKFDSGQPEHARNFRSIEEWLKESLAPSQFICPATFKCNSIARSNDNILVRRFLVVESDELTKDEVGAVFRWLRESAELELVAIVDTAGKSLHGWFGYPEDEQTAADLRLILPAFGCDPKLFTPSQPVRLPGALREWQHQKLIFLNGSEEVCHA